MNRSLRVLPSLILLALLLPLAAGAQEPIPPPGPFSPEVYRQRREKLMDKMGEGIAVLYVRGSHDREDFVPDGDFYYLTGLAEEDAVLILAPGERFNRHNLFLAPRDPELERWMGDRPSLGDSLEKATGFDAVYRTNRVNSILPRLLLTSTDLHLINRVSLNGPQSPEKELYGKVQSRLPEISIKNSTQLLPYMRSIKEQRELERMQLAIDATITAHRAAARAIAPGVEENWVESIIMTEFQRGGATRPAFPSIVGSGSNSTILHYPDRDNTIADGSLVVVDIGSDYDHYAADITRTYPANGTFTARQREIYEIVLRIQAEIIEMVKPGVYLADLQRKTEELMNEAGYGKYFIHGISHWVGLDVHDAGLRHKPLEENMVITVEPGIYIPEEALGVRIEDEILVTKSGSRLLTGDLPSDVAGVEAMMRGD